MPVPAVSSILHPCPLPVVRGVVPLSSLPCRISGVHWESQTAWGLKTDNSRYSRFSQAFAPKNHKKSTLHWGLVSAKNFASHSFVLPMPPRVGCRGSMSGAQDDEVKMWVMAAMLQFKMSKIVQVSVKPHKGAWRSQSARSSSHSLWHKWSYMA